MSKISDGNKSWKQIHKENKELKKKYREENYVRKLEKTKKQESKEAANIEKNVFEPVSTVSIAVPGSILENAQSAELRTYLAGQIARAACIFRVDEVVVFDEDGSGPSDTKKSRTEVSDDGSPAARHCCLQLARILQYLECPQYLRKFFFPIHKDLKFSGLLNPLDAPHHLRQQNDFIYREGVVTNKPAKESKGSYVNIGLLNDCLVDKVLTPGIRVTVKLNPNQDLKSRKLMGCVVSPSQPRSDTGIYWGYSVRIASSFADIFTQAPYEDGYDLTIGTSDKGESVHSVENGTLEYNHAIVVFGGLLGLEAALENEDKLDVDNPSLIFNQYLNISPTQGSRTIRTEEAILITLAALEEKLLPQKKTKPFTYTDSIAHSEDTGVKQFQGTKDKKRKTKMVSNEQHNSANDDLSKFD